MQSCGSRNARRAAWLPVKATMNARKRPIRAPPDIAVERSKYNYHFVPPPRYIYKKEINRKVAEAGQDTERQRDDGGNAYHRFVRIYEQTVARGTERVLPDSS